MGEKKHLARILLACAALAMNGALMFCFAVVSRQSSVGTEAVLGMGVLSGLTVLSAVAYYWTAYRGRRPKSGRIPFSFAIMFQYLPLWGVSFCIYRYFRKALGLWNGKDIVYAVMLATAGLVLLICISYLVLAMRGILPQGGKHPRSHGRI